MDEQEQAKQALMEMFRRDRAEVAVHPKRKRPRRLVPGMPLWLLGVAMTVLVLGSGAFLVIYPRFGPVDTMTSFCNAELDGKYTTAYALLSKHAQQRISLDNFTQASQGANLESCSPNHGIPIIFWATQASLDAAFQFYASGEVDGSMTFVREHDGWRVDTMTPDVFHLSS